MGISECALYWYPSNDNFREQLISNICYKNITCNQFAHTQARTWAHTRPYKPMKYTGYTVSNAPDFFLAGKKVGNARFFMKLISSFWHLYTVVKTSDSIPAAAPHKWVSRWCVATMCHYRIPCCQASEKHPQTPFQCLWKCCLQQKHPWTMNENDSLWQEKQSSMKCLIQAIWSQMLLLKCWNVLMPLGENQCITSR